MSVLTIDISGFKKMAKDIDLFNKKVEEIVEDVLNTQVVEMEGVAKRLAPGNMGFLRGQIKADTDTKFVKKLTANAFYASYMEFGTGKYAAQYIATLPGDWQTFARQFKSDSNKRTIKGMLFFLARWFEKKGITDKNHAYHIAKNIVINGTRAHPFLYKAFIAQKDQFADDIKAAINAINI